MRESTYSDIVQGVLSKQQKMFIGSPKRKKFRMNFINNSIHKVTQDQPIEQRKLCDYLEDTTKDSIRYQKVKQSMKDKFFKIRTKRRHSLFDKKIKFSNPSEANSDQIFHSSGLLTDRRPTTREQFTRQFQRVLNLSTQLTASQRKLSEKKKPRIISRSQISKKNDKILNEERDLIIKFIKKQNRADKNPRKVQLTNKQKFTMDFNTYLKRKSERQIQKHFFQNKIRVKTKPMDKFQDFILEEVKFTQENRQKLSKFFTQMRHEVSRAERNK